MCMVLDAMFIHGKQHVGFIHLENFESPVGFGKQISFVTKIRFFFLFNYLWKRTTISYTIFIFHLKKYPSTSQTRTEQKSKWILEIDGFWINLISDLYKSPQEPHTASSGTNSVDEFQFLWQHSKLLWLQLNTRFDKWLPLFRAFEFTHKRAKEWDLNPFW